MSHAFSGGPIVAFTEHLSFSIRAFAKNALERIRTSIKRRRERRELLDYIASDHRAAADLGISVSAMHRWPRYHFWRG
jgi:hypothetical protein